MVARGIGRVGRDGDATGGHDRQVRNQPLGPVLADQRDAVARLEADAPERCRKRSDLPRRLGPSDRTPLTLAFGPEEWLVLLVACAAQEQRDKIVEMFELSARLHSCAPLRSFARRGIAVTRPDVSIATPSLRGSAAPTHLPPTYSMAFALSPRGP